MLARPRAGDIEQSALGFVDVVELCLVRGVGDTLVERQLPSSQAITMTARNSKPFARLIGAVVMSPSPVRPAIVARARVTSCGVLTNRPISWGASRRQARSRWFGARCRLPRRWSGGSHLGRRTIEDRNDSAPLVLKSIGVPQHRRQELIGGAANLLRGAVADFKRV